MRKLSIVLVVLVLGVLGTMAIPRSLSMTRATVVQEPLVPGALFQLEAVDAPSAGLSTTQVLSNTHTFLPAIMSNHRVCPLESPFSITIAALHQVVPDETGRLTAQPLTEAEWLALYEEAYPTLVEALRDSGACWSRVGINWSWIQPDAPPAPYVWGPYHDEKLALVAESGVHLIGTIGSVPDWARGEPYPDLSCTQVDPDQLGAFAQFLFDLVNRYKEPPWNIHHWELFNEPDGTERWLDLAGIGCGGDFGDRYANMLAWAYPYIKAADPTATVLMGGLAYDNFTEYDGPFNRYFVDEVMANGGAQYIDAINFHYFHDFHLEWERWVPEGNPPTCGDVEDGLGDPYEAWGIDLIAKTNHFRNRLSTCFQVDKPVWITELAEHGVPNDSESLAQQARYVIQGYSRGLAAGAENITWFALVTPPYDLQHQGLLYDDFTPKPAYYAYQTLTRELAGHEYAYALSIPNVEGYVFQSSSAAEKTVAWGSGELTINSASQVRVVDRFGNVTIVQDGGTGDADGSRNARVVLQLTQDPVFVSR